MDTSGSLLTQMITLPMPKKPPKTLREWCIENKQEKEKRMIILTTTIVDTLNEIDWYSFEDLFMDISPQIIAIITSAICTLLCIRDRCGLLKFVVALLYLGVASGIYIFGQYLHEHKWLFWTITIVSIIFCSIIRIIKNIKYKKDRKRYEETYGRKP